MATLEETSSVSKVNNEEEEKMQLVAEKNLEVVRGLAPAGVWEAFAKLSAVPRPSGKETRILAHLASVLSAFESKQDAAGNLLVKVPASSNCALAKPVLIQGHVDMVTEKNAEVRHDFDTDGIELKRTPDEKYVSSAKATTLGADNGLGVAAAVAVALSNDVSRPPLELLFTVDEETGLTGAKRLDARALGIEAKLMLNLDTEEWGSVYVGCSGGGDSTLAVPAAYDSDFDNDSSCQYFKISLSGCSGGHSGIDIHRGRCNAVAELAGAALSLFRTFPGSAARLCSIEGGDKRNAIPREASMTFLIPNEIQEAFESKVNDLKENLVAKFITTDADLKFDAEPLKSPNEAATSLYRPLTADCSLRLCELLSETLPRGALKMSADVEGLVETSNNVAAVRHESEDARFVVTCSTRSSVTADLEAVRDRIADAARTAGGEVVSRPPAYPGWKPNMQSKALHLATKLYEARAGKPADIKAIHAGLECGLLIEKIDASLDCVSFGPTILEAHTPDEMVEINTVQPFFSLLTDILADLAREDS